MKVKFKNVGRYNASWSVECEELTEDWVYNQVKNHCITKNPLIAYDEETNRGVVSENLRVIGWFSVEDTD